MTYPPLTPLPSLPFSLSLFSLFIEEGYTVPELPAWLLSNMYHVSHATGKCHTPSSAPPQEAADDAKDTVTHLHPVHVTYMFVKEGVGEEEREEGRGGEEREREYRAEGVLEGLVAGVTEPHVRPVAASVTISFRFNSVSVCFLSVIIIFLHYPLPLLSPLLSSRPSSSLLSAPLLSLLCFSSILKDTSTCHIQLVFR